MFVTNTVLGGAGFSVPSGGEYLRTASGYPLVLSKTLAKLPESITVYGAAGGVGDENKNWLADYSGEVAKGYISTNTGLGLSTNVNGGFTQDTTYLPAGTYTVGFSNNSTNGIAVLLYESDAPMLVYNHTGTYIGYKATANISSTYTTSYESPLTFTLDNGYYVRIGWRGNISDITTDIILREGVSKNAAYKIPIILSYGSADKTINLYTDIKLPSPNISVTVNPTTKKATRINTDISALQDWEQDFTLPKADELTVTAGTTVEPSGMEVEYWSSEKE